MTDRAPVRPHVLPVEHVEHVVEHDFSDLHAHEAELEGRRRRMAAAAATAHTRSAMLRWGLGIGAVVLAAGLGLTGVVWAASLLRDQPPPLVIEKPVIVDREKPVIVEKEKLVVVEPKVIEKPVPAPPAGEPERKAEEIRDRLERDQRQAGKTVTNFTIFHQADMATFPHLAVVTGWDYADRRGQDAGRAVLLRPEPQDRAQLPDCARAASSSRSMPTWPSVSGSLPARSPRRSRSAGGSPAWRPTTSGMRADAASFVPERTFWPRSLD